MDTLKPYTIVMEQSSKTNKTEKNFEALSDKELRDLIARANGVLETRLNERRQTALAEIRRIARENGLSVSVRNAARRRGRTPGTRSKKG